MLAEDVVVRDVRADVTPERGALDDVRDAGRRTVVRQHGRLRLEFHSVWQLSEATGSEWKRTPSARSAALMAAGDVGAAGRG
jgi:hypothetical protein